MASTRVPTDTIVVTVIRSSVIEMSFTESTPIEVQDLKKEIKGKKIWARILQACADHGYEVVTQAAVPNVMFWTLQKFS